MYQIEYAALKYYNSPISEECLYLGMVFNNITTGQREFRYISNFSRFQAFDDEADIDFIKMYLHGMKSDIENNIFNLNTFDLKQYVSGYANEIKFSDIMSMEVEDDEEYVDNLTRLFLKYDFAKKKRLSVNEEMKYIRKIFSSKNVEFSKKVLRGSFDEDISFDYVINEKIAIKFFSFKEKNLKKMIASAKQWSFTAQELGNTIKVVFMYDISDGNEKELKIILDILGKNAFVFQTNEGIDYVLKEVS